MSIYKIAKGSKSKLVMVPEATFGTPNTGQSARAQLFSTESLVEMVETFESQDIRPDRTTSALRGGNIACGGTFTSDFGIRRADWLLAQLLAVSAMPTAGTTTYTAITTALAVTRGSYYSITISGSTYAYVALSTGTYTKVLSTEVLDFTGLTTVGSTYLVGGISWQLATVTSGSSAGGVSTYTLNGGVDFMTGGLSVEKQIIGGASPLYILYNGGRVDSLELTVAQKDIVKAQWSLEFLSSTTGAATLLAPSAVYNPNDDPVSGFDCFVSLASNGAIRPLKEATLSIKNNIDKEGFVLNQRTRIDLPEGMRKINGKITTFFEDATEYNIFKNEQVISLTFSFIHNGETMLLTFNEVKLTGSGTPQVGGQGMITASFDWTAFKQVSSNDVTVVITSTSANVFTAALT